MIAGSIDSAERIGAATRLGAWGFTIGGAVFERVLPAGPSLSVQVEWTLRTAEGAAAG